MATFICKDGCHYTKEVPEVKYTFKDGKLVPSYDIPCPQCGKIMFEEVTVGDIISPETFSVGRFASMTPEEKKLVIKQRAERHHQMFTAEEVARRRKETILNMKQEFEKNVKL